METNKLVVVLGVMGNVGGHLIAELIEAGYKVRAVSRSIRKLQFSS